MLVIDSNMFKLARMQETLLKVSAENREENLKKYKEIVLEIDAKAYYDILEEIKHIDEHNHSLEDELHFLESIMNTYNQLLELQLSFKRICETYGDDELKLSDLSRLNIEYIENRINAINGYLVNLKNIEINKEKLQNLNEQLIDEEKKKISLDKKLLELEDTLRNNFCSAEGRCLVDGNLVYTSVISEYEKIGFDFKQLLDDNAYLKSLLSEIEREKNEVSEKVRVAEVCYNSILTADSKQVLNEINLEFFKVKYKLIMLKILELLAQNNDNYDLFNKKRENILELIKYRLSYMEHLGMKISIDPFSRTKVKEQLSTVASLTDNSKVINVIRKEISRLNSWTEEMISQNNNYLITLSDTRDLIESNLGLGDIDISSVVSFEELLVKQEVANNQVVSVRNIPSKLNMNIVIQKTVSVIKRVNQMMNSSKVTKIELKEEVVPELIIVKDVVNEIKKEEDVVVSPEIVIAKEFENEFENSVLIDDVIEEDEKSLVIDEEKNKNEVSGTVNFDLFETVTPFEAPSLFMERTEDTSKDNVIDSLEPLTLIEENEIDSLDEENEIDSLDEENFEEELTLQFTEPEEVEFDDEKSEEVMPEAFWVTQEEELDDEEEIISFDDQINALLSSENNDSSKVRKRVA